MSLRYNKSFFQQSLASLVSEYKPEKEVMSPSTDPKYFGKSFSDLKNVSKD